MEIQKQDINKENSDLLLNVMNSESPKVLTLEGAYKLFSTKCRKMSNFFNNHIH